jgi:hypothetical protein
MPLNDSIPTPPRYRWLKRLSLLYLLLVAATVALRYRWLAVGRRAVDAQIAGYRQAGQPVLGSDFSPPMLPEAQNAAVALRAAADALKYTTEENDFLRDLSVGTPTPVELLNLGHLVDAHRAALGHVRRARALPSLDWGFDFNQPMIAMLLPDISPQRGVAYFLQSACRVAHARGQDDQALEHCRDLLFHARAMGRQPALVAMLVSIGIDNMATSLLWQILPTLRLDDPATRRAAIALIHDLLDDGGVRDGAVWSIYAERAAQLDIARRMGQQGNNPALGMQETPLERFLVWWFRPIIEDDTRAMMADTTGLAQAVAAPDAVTSRQLMPPGSGVGGGSNSFTDVMLHPISRALVPSLGAAMQRTYVGQRDRRAAAIDLAAGAAMTRAFAPATTQISPK